MPFFREIARKIMVCQQAAKFALFLGKNVKENRKT